MNYFRWIARDASLCLLPVCVLLCRLPFTAAQENWSGSADPYATGFNLDRTWDNNNWFNVPPGNRNWPLGATGTNSDTGVIVRQVIPNSIAAQNGINVGDTIVCVGGAQVGRVGNQVFDVTEEINRRADARGRVSLVVQDSRSLQLRPIRMRLNDPQTSPQGGLSGTLFVNSGQLPPNAIATVQLENVDRPYFVVRNGQISFRPAAFNGGRIPFVLNYDPGYISAGDRYRVRATITSNGRTIYDTPQAPFVLTQGNPSNVQLVLTAVGYGGGSGGVQLPGYPGYDAITQQIVAMYQRYLGRSPSTVELAAWTQFPDVEYRLANAPLELMAAQEYFDRVGNNNTVWLRAVFGEILGRAPTPIEEEQWMRRYAQVGYSRMEVLRQLKQVTGR